MGQLYHYMAYGLHIASEFEIPELPIGEGRADLTVACGRVHRSLETPHFLGSLFQTTPTQSLLFLKEKVGADLMITNGRQIIVDYQDTNRMANIRLAILGYGLTTVLCQRHFLVLHANALLSPKGAIAICGHQKAGKSTTTMGLFQCGYHVIADDLTAVALGGQPQVQPGYPRLKLWADTLRRFDQPTERLTRVVEELNKFSFPIQNRFHNEKSILNAVYILEAAAVGDVQIRQLAGMNKLLALSKQIRSFTPAQLPQGSAWLFSTCAWLAEQVAVFEIKRPAQEDTVDTIVGLIDSYQRR